MNERYIDYMRSEHWKKIKNECMAFFGGFCVRCGSSEPHLHHLTYNNLGNERPVTDCVLLCKDCHNIVHYAKSHDPKYKIAGTLDPYNYKEQLNGD